MLSRAHPLARRLRALRSDAKEREAEGAYVAEGIHLAGDALSAHATIEAAIVSPRLADSAEGRELLRRLDEAGVRLETTSEATLAGLQDARSPQPVVLIVRRETYELDDVLAGRGGTPLIVVACGVQEPGNLGALWRTADAAGATGFITTRGSASLTHPRTVRASMGAVFRLLAVEAGVGETLERVHSREFRVYGAEARGGEEYDRVAWEGAVALLLGGEGGGLPDEVLPRLDQRVRIPMALGVDSLSVNAAAAVILFEAARKRRPVSRGG